MNELYTAEALATGAGRDGHVVTKDGQVEFDLAAPESMGGSGDGANPEQLFASGYAACFHGALQLVAKKDGVDVADSSIGSQVTLGKDDEGNLQLAVILEVVLPGVEKAKAQDLADKAHQVCPYSRATRGNIDVEIRVAED
ncbi:organic hydroperoxide resistance protein [Zhihengliuella flava]|uniref:Ohr subfamily peroxiredoxin n=1 Tax=Zhihengliuella flava TaxID=1285193 RepID=A0A931D3P8_9MICC|nr:organic hydroperoxide resistance protein [Zhihengliuella flava]MBG6083834.1 Ohr subfamily peroxiredoxin [Zhihengliuella flava]